MTRNRKSLPLFAVLIAASLAAVRSVSAGDVDYESKVLPILREHCLSCHSPDRKKAGLDLASYPALLAGGSGGEVVVAGDPDSSRLLQLISHEAEPKMPPNQARLPDATIDVVRQWIAAGLLEREGGARQEIEAGPNLGAMSSQASSSADDLASAMPERLPKEPWVVPTRRFAPSGMAASPRAPLLAIAAQRQVLLYHTDSFDLLGVIPFPDGQPRSIRFSPDGRLLIVGGGEASRRGFASVFQVQHGDLLLRAGDELDELLDADLSADGTQLVIASPLKKARRIAANGSGDVLQTIDKHSDWVTQAAFSPDGVLLATGDRAGGLMIWEAFSGQEYLSLEDQKGTVTAISWRADSNIVATTSEDGFIRLFEMNEGKVAKAVRAHSGGATAVQFAPDGRFVTGGRDRLAKFFDGAGKELRSFGPQPDIVVAVAVTHDGERIFSADWTGDIAAYDTTSGTRVGSVEINPISLAARLAVAEERLKEANTALLKSERTHAEASKEELAARKDRDRTAKEQEGIEGLLREAGFAHLDATDALKKGENVRDAAARSLEIARTRSENAKADRRASQGVRDELARRVADLKAGAIRLDQVREQLLLAASSTRELANETGDADIMVAANNAERAALSADVALKQARKRTQDATAEGDTAEIALDAAVASQSAADAITATAEAQLNDADAQVAKLLAAVQKADDRITEIAQTGAPTLAAVARNSTIHSRLDAIRTETWNRVESDRAEQTLAILDRRRWEAEQVNLICSQARGEVLAAERVAADQMARHEQAQESWDEIAFSLQDAIWRLDELDGSATILAGSLAADREKAPQDSVQVKLASKITADRARLEARLSNVFSSVRAPEVETAIAPIRQDRLIAEQMEQRARAREEERLARIRRNDGAMTAARAASAALPKHIRSLQDKLAAATEVLNAERNALEGAQLTLANAKKVYDASEARYTALITLPRPGSITKQSATATESSSDPTGTR